MGAPASALAPIIPIDRPRRGRPSLADDLRLEFDARVAEERRMAREVGPLVQRLFLIAHEHGPAAHQTVAALHHLITRHARRWSPEPSDAA